jgi:hypothetical protein
MPFLASSGAAYGYGRSIRPQANAIVTSGLLLNLDAGNSSSYSGSGTTWFDLTGNNRNATLFNTPTYNSGCNGYLSFLDTSIQYATIPNIGNQSTWTVEAWTRTTASLSGKVTAVVCNQFNLTTTLNFSLGTNRAPGSYNLCVGYYNSAWRTTNGFTPTLNVWYQIVGTYDGSTLTQYSNANVNTTLSYTGTSQSGGEIRIARRWDATNVASDHYRGDISIVRIYNRALSAAEVGSNYNAIKGRYGLL